MKGNAFQGDKNATLLIVGKQQMTDFTDYTGIKDASTGSVDTKVFRICYLKDIETGRLMDRYAANNTTAAIGASGSYANTSDLYAYSFDNGLPEAVKPLMRCSEASSYGLYALLDICIHYGGWDLATTTSYLENSYGFTDPESAREIYLAIIDNPGNYLKYYTGYLEILTMRQEADEVLGNKFNAKSFHQFILNMDGASFRVIKPYFQTWLMTEKLHV